ncbi:hypothetical protein FJTKL_02036 [Diaporthe vaccinii]|uniref:BZIP domain-containing protein n=1 Tax=Diaporthe vaccinii TaxID=105482 RepID=A0ABR4DZ78_9PEZI
MDNTKRRRIQNRMAQRLYRIKLKERMANLQNRAGKRDSNITSVRLTNVTSRGAAQNIKSANGTPLPSHLR